jgi:cytochrome c553
VQQGPPAQLGLCIACHTDAGRSGPPGTPRLAGQDQTYLQASLLAYRNGDRRHPGMRAIAGALSAADIEALAAWYAAQPACVPDV